MNQQKKKICIGFFDTNCNNDDYNQHYNNDEHISYLHCLYHGILFIKFILKFIVFEFSC